MKKSITTFWVLICALSVMAAPSPPTVNVTLIWNPSPSPEVNSYNIYYGISTNVPGWNGTNVICQCYTNFVPVGVSTNLTLSGLMRDANYYFSATAVSTNGLESDYTNEVLFKAGKKPNPPGKLTIQ